MSESNNIRHELELKLLELDPKEDAKAYAAITKALQQVNYNPKKVDPAVVAAIVAGTATVVAATVTAVCNCQNVKRITKYEEENVVTTTSMKFIK